MLKLLPSREHLQTAVAAAGLLALAALFGVVHELGNSPGGFVPYVVETIAVGLAAGAVYLLLLWLLGRFPDRRAALWIIFLGALIFRLQLLPIAPGLSDDLYRYRWEGRVQAAGENPYLAAPDDPRLASLRETDWERIPGRDAPSIYGPLLELLFAGVYRAVSDYPLAGALVLTKLPALAADWMLALLLALHLLATGGRNWQAAVYAWNPLVAFEAGAGGHYDPIVALAVVAACLALGRGREVRSTLLLAAGVLLKWFPAVLVPLWLRRTNWPRRWQAWLYWLSAAALAAVCVWPYRSAWPQAIENFTAYAARWRHNNASLYTLLTWFSSSEALAAGVAAGIVAGLALWLAARRAEPLRAAYLLVGAILLLSPNAFSWYFVWLVPLLAFFPNPAWLLLTVLQFLSYHVVIEYHPLGTWQFRSEMLWLTYGPFYALAVWHLWKQDRGRPAAS